jgi:hypothetical protein
MKRTADPSASLGMTKGRVTLPFGVLVVITISQTLFIEDCVRDAEGLPTKQP